MWAVPMRDCSISVCLSFSAATFTLPSRGKALRRAPDHILRIEIPARSPGSGNPEWRCLSDCFRKESAAQVIFFGTIPATFGRERLVQADKGINSDLELKACYARPFISHARHSFPSCC